MAGEEPDGTGHPGSLLPVTLRAADTFAAETRAGRLRLRGPLRSAYCPRVWRSRKRTPPLALPELAMLMNTEEQRGVDPETSGGSALRAELPAEAPVGHTAVLWMPARSGSCP